MGTVSCCWWGVYVSGIGDATCPNHGDVRPLPQFSRTPERRTCISGERLTGMKTAGFAGGLARVEAAAGGAGGAAVLA